MSHAMRIKCLDGQLENQPAARHVCRTAGAPVLISTRKRPSMPSTRPLTTCLWFDNQAEDAAKFYTSIFRNSKIGNVARYPNAGQEIHGKPAGSVMAVSFELNGQAFMALNGGPIFKFNEAVSIIVYCDTQKEIDYYWEKLGAGGDPNAQQCGWLKDRFGLSWQVTPPVLDEIFETGDPAARERAMSAMLAMKKIDIKAIERARDGKE